jgi:hypothetical protein
VYIQKRISGMKSKAIGTGNILWQERWKKWTASNTDCPTVMGKLIITRMEAELLQKCP